MKNLAGTPVNTKSLLAFIFNQMEKLDKGDIDANTACAQAKLASQANNILNYELKRTIVQMKMEQMGCGIERGDIRLREIESKGFDNSKYNDYEND